MYKHKHLKQNNTNTSKNDKAEHHMYKHKHKHLKQNNTNTSKNG